MTKRAKMTWCDVPAKHRNHVLLFISGIAKASDAIPIVWPKASIEDLNEAYVIGVAFRAAIACLKAAAKPIMRAHQCEYFYEEDGACWESAKRKHDGRWVCTDHWRIWTRAAKAVKPSRRK